MSCKLHSRVNNYHKILSFFSLFFLLSCNGFDNDVAFRYSLKSTFLISSKSEVYRCIDVSDSLKIEFFLSNIHDGNIIEEFVYFVDTNHKKLFIYKNPFETATTRNLNKPYSLVNGWKNFRVFANSIECILEDKNQSLTIQKGGDYIFCNQGRMWLIQKRKVFIYDMTAGTVIDSFVLQRDFEFADYNRGFNLFVYTKDSSGLYQKYFDTNAISSGNETKVDFLRIQHTKVLTRLYETEYLRNVEKNLQNQLNIPGFTEKVDSYDMDFQSSRLFYTRNDSLFLFHLNTSKKQFLKANFGILKKGLHFYSQ